MNLQTLPIDFVALASLVWLLGLRHGFDADHLAAIDGMTRFNAKPRPRLARRTGALFSLGHGVVVVAVAFAVSQWAHSWQAPHWLESFGAWVSIAVLLALGILNIVSVLRTPAHESVALLG